MSGRVRWLGALLAGVLAVTVLLAGTASTSDEELVEQIRTGMYERYRAVTSCRGSVHLVTTHPMEEGEKLSIVQVVTVAFDGERLRMSGQVHTGEAANFEGLYDGETTTEWLDIAGARRYDGKKGVTRGMFSIFVDPRSIGAWPQTILHRQVGWDAAIVDRTEVDGSECAVVEFSSPITRVRVWVDMERGFAVHKLLVWYLPEAGEAVLMRAEEVDLKQYAEGLWGAARYTRVDYRPDGTVEKKVYGTYDPGFEINVPISEEDLAFTLPPGMKVLDERPGTPDTAP
jgi:hypothetical protein